MSKTHAENSTKSKIRMKLVLAMGILCAIPFCVTYFLAGDTLETAIGVGFNKEVSRVITDYQHTLKDARKLDPKSEGKYKEKFLAAQELQAIYSQPDLISDTLHSSLKSYFLIGLALAVVIALISATIISAQISNSYNRLFDEWTSQQERVNYLETLSAWQGVARKLAHEIKNPLTPIELMISNVGRNLNREVDPEQLKKSFADAYSIISEEIAHLKEMVSSFSEFGQLPRANPISVDLSHFLDEYIRNYSDEWSNIKIVPEVDRHISNMSLDPSLFRQVLTNLIRNASEANQDQDIKIKLSAKKNHDWIQIDVSDNGKGIPSDEFDKIFNLYFSTKKNEGNMGVGLSVVKKIVIEHGGDITLLPSSGGAHFRINLPRKIS